MGAEEKQRASAGLGPGPEGPGSRPRRPRYLRMARDTFCFQGLSFLIPIPKPERKNSSPVVTRSHFWDASNSSTALSQMKAWSLLQGGGAESQPGPGAPG